MSAQMLTPASPSAGSAEDFRFGLQSFHRGYFNEAILSLERALSRSPEESLISFWLANSYMRSGFESTAIDQLERISGDGRASPFILSRLETLALRSRSDIGPDFAERLVETGTIVNTIGKDVLYSRPTWISPGPGSSYWVTAMGSDSILRLDVNGIIRDKWKGPAGGFDRPFCAIPDGKGGLFVSEYGMDRISRLDSRGAVTSRFGAKGRGKGQLIGPQYLCLDDSGYLYVSEYGNRRISKFSPEGQFTASFGQASGAFPGLIAPTGIAWLNGSLYAADAYAKAIYAFDRDGNYLATSLSQGLAKPEGLQATASDSIIVADTGRILAFDARAGSLTLLYSGADASNRLVCGMPDQNGGIIACDFDSSKIFYLSEPSLVYAGFDLSVLRVNADSFPLVDAEVLVRDSKGRPVIGLGVKNFYVTEQIATNEERLEGDRKVSFEVKRIQTVPSMDLIGSEPGPGKLATALLFDSSAETKRAAAFSGEVLATALSSIMDKGGSVTVYGSDPPSIDVGASPESIVRRLAAQVPRRPVKIDAAIRLSVSKLAAAEPRRAVFFFTSGDSGEESFSSNRLADLAAFMRNNNVRFYAIATATAAPGPDIAYLARSSGGGVLSLFDPQGIAPLVDRAAAVSTGVYALRFKSAAPTDFGKAYIPFAVEAYLLKRSGRDESGYFAPLR
jgi:DNA-binding beta-propeller fold protein YncE